MPLETPFHPSTFRRCSSLLWKDWAGYYAVKSYVTSHDPEYFALRHAVGAIDVSPLFKYEVKGVDAAAFLSRLTVKNIHKLKPGRVTYLCWCDDDGKVIDDGTVMCLEENHYRVTAAEPSLSWFSRLSRGFSVTIEDVSYNMAALSVQGPRSRDLLTDVCAKDMTKLKFFGLMQNNIGGSDVWITRTGYTGDLGYEVWATRDNAEQVYEAIFAAGPAHGLMPVGLDAMDVTRVEAGFILNGVDYYSAHHCFIDERKNSPYEIGLGWTVQLDREPFIGQKALQREKEQGSERVLVGLDVDWDETEKLFNEFGLPPEICSMAWRDGRPVYDQAGQWIGQATSGTWSPILKKNLILAQVRTPFAKEGTMVKAEQTVEYERFKIAAKVVKTPFFNPERKRS